MKVSEKSRVRTIDLLSLLSDDTKEAMREFRGISQIRAKL